MTIDFSRPQLMGILNLTPDSFSDGGVYVETALERVQDLLDDGADIIDIGAESTFGPEAQVDADTEWQRLESVLSAIDSSQVFVSVDTYKASVAERALDLGVQMINDVTALRGDPEMQQVLLKYQPYVCLMYSADETPYASRSAHQYDDVIKSVSTFLQTQSQLLLEKGYPKERIIIDPGLGFFLSSDPAVSWEVIERLKELTSLGFPILIGPSMKSFLGGDIADRLPATLKASSHCVNNGANILRVHDVAAHRALECFSRNDSERTD